MTNFTDSFLFSNIEKIFLKYVIKNHYFFSVWNFPVMLKNLSVIWVSTILDLLRLILTFFFARRSSKLDVIRSKFGKILSLVPVDAQVLKTLI